ncbi:amino acid permease, partial [Gemmatimonadota bacterium]
LWIMAHKPGWQGSFDPFFVKGWGGIFGAMGLTFIAFEGYEIIAQTSEEVEDPKRNIPRAVFLSLLIVIPIYLLVAVVAIGAVNPPAGTAITDYLAQGGETALVAAADQFFVGGAILILVGGLLSTVSALNATIYSSSRVAFAMARDASLPETISRVHPRRGTPHFAILFSTLLIIGMAVALPIEDVAAAASVMFLLLFGGVNIALIRLRRLRPDLDRGYRVPFVPFTPILAVATMLFIAVFMFVGYPLAWLAAGGWIVAGIVFYYAYSRSRELAHTERLGWMERLEKKQYRVLVAIANPAAVGNLMPVAVAVASKHAGEIVVTSVVEVPEGESLFTGRRRTRELEPLLERCVRFAESRGVAATSVVKIGRRTSQSIVQTAREEACNLLILGQPSGRMFMERLVSSIGDRVLQKAPCQVAVVYGSMTHGPVRSVVVPVTAGKNSLLASELTPAIGEWVGGPTRFITIVPDDVDSGTAEKAVGIARDTMGASGIPGELEVIHGPDPGRGLVSAVRPDELVLVGAPSSGPISPLFGETVPGLLAARSEGPVVIVRNVEPHHARRFRRFFFG